jgi:hypothetical protein
MTKSPMSKNEKEDFISFLASSTPEELNEFIKKNGKNNANDALFVFQWDNLKKDGKHTQIITN